jgi:hypothetical protein
MAHLVLLIAWSNLLTKGKAWPAQISRNLLIHSVGTALNIFTESGHGRGTIP